MLYLGCWQAGQRGGARLSKADSPALLTISRQGLLQAEGGDCVQTQHSQPSQVSSDGVTGGLTSIVLIVLNAVSLQFHG